MQFPTGSHHPPRSHENPRCNSQAKGIQSKSKCLAEKIVSFAETEGLEPQTHDSLFLFQDVFFKASSCQFPILPKKAGSFLLKKKKQPCWDTKLTSTLVRRLTPTGGIRTKPAWHSFASWPPFNDIQTANTNEGCEGLGTEPGGSTGGPRKIPSEKSSEKVRKSKN